MAEGNGGTRWALLVPIAVAIIGFVSSPVWGPPICRAVTVCPPENGQPSERPIDVPDPFEPARIFLSSTSGPAGSEIKVSGEGFASGEEIVFRFHTDEVGRTNAGPNGSFSSVEVTVPEGYGMFAPRQFNVVATGQSSIKSATAAFTVSG